jgi:hypothetical protein
VKTKSAPVLSKLAFVVVAPSSETSWTSLPSVTWIRV